MTSNRYKEAVTVLAICALVILFVLVTDNNADKVQHPATMEAEPTPEWWATATLTPHPLSTTAATPVPTATNTPTIDSLTENGRSVSATVIVNGWRVYLSLAVRNHQGTGEGDLK